MAEAVAVLGPQTGEKTHFHNLDGLRGIAILLVLLFHVPRVKLPWLLAFQLNGLYGVDLFFVLSGFLICSLLLREERSTGQIHLKNFYARRILRIQPLYYAVLLFYVAAISFTAI